MTAARRGALRRGQAAAGLGALVPSEPQVQDLDAKGIREAAHPEVVVVARRMPTLLI